MNQIAAMNTYLKLLRHFLPSWRPPFYTQPACLTVLYIVLTVYYYTHSVSRAGRSVNVLSSSEVIRLPSKCL